jgi:murein L,D-transpeptidase YcbB/YkuD
LRILAAIFAIALPVGWAAWATEPAATTSPKTAAKKKAAPKTSSGKTATTTSASKTGTGALKTTASAHPAPTASNQKKSTAKQQASTRYHRSAQLQPAPDRYKEIQQALADKGYFAGPVDGNWTPTSVDALKRFQHDQSLTEDGKIGSLSVIALGLGPRRGGLSPLAEPAPHPETPPDPPLDPK